MELDRNGLEVLDRDGCTALLASASIGRIGLSMQALPVILPVNFVVDGDDLVVRTARGAKLEAALRGAVVAFEADDHDPIAHTGWSVLVRGRARVLDEPEQIDRLRHLWVSAWGTPDADRWIAIAMEIVSGRRIRHDLAPATDGRAYEAPGGPTPAPALFAPVDAVWESWAVVRADLHSTAAAPRTAAAPTRTSWAVGPVPDPPPDEAVR